MTKTNLILSLALAVSVMINLALLRREPAASPAPGVRPSTPQGATPPSPTTAAVSPSPTKVRTADVETDVVFLREEIRKLREELTVANARRGLDRYHLSFSGDDAADQPEVREFRELMGHVTSFIQHGPAKRLLPPDRRAEAMRLLEDYAALDGSIRTSFRDQALAALAAYHRLYEAFEGEHKAAKMAAENDDFFEDANVRNQAIYDRMARRTEEWKRDHIDPLRALLSRRDGVRPALLSHNLPGLLMQLGAAAER